MIGTPSSSRLDHTYGKVHYTDQSTQTDPVHETEPDTDMAEHDFEPSSEITGSSPISDVDPLYHPSSTDSTDESPAEENGNGNNRKYLVYESALNELLQLCKFCGAAVVQQERRTVGSMLVCDIQCHNGHSYIWQSQPLLRNTPAGNLELAAAILYTGGTYTKLAAFAGALNMEFISKTSFNTLQITTLFPVIQEAWLLERERAALELKQLGPCVLAGDARCDSPGHSAKYGSYTLMAIPTSSQQSTTNQIVAMNLIQVSEVRDCKQIIRHTLRWHK